jgi:hypothetical protein
MNLDELIALICVSLHAFLRTRKTISFRARTETANLEVARMRVPPWIKLLQVGDQGEVVTVDVSDGIDELR